MQESEIVVRSGVVDPNSLHAHPKNKDIYDRPEGKEWEDYLRSIEQNGVIEPIVIFPDNTILSGHRRWQAALELKLTEVPVKLRERPTSEAQELLTLIEANRYRKKKISEIMREAEILESLEEKLGWKGATGKVADGKPQGRSKERIADALGIGSYVTYDKTRKVWEAAKNNAGIREALKAVDEGKKSINSVWKLTQKLLYPQGEGPGFDLKVYTVWQFSERDPALGMDHPGAIPGQIVQNLLWYCTEPGDLVVDPFGGGGITVDACALSGRESLVMDITPVRDDIREWDISNGFPSEAEGAQLIFLDPPYSTMLEEEYLELHKDSAGGLSLDGFLELMQNVIASAEAALKPGGYCALIIMPQYFKFPVGYDEKLHGNYIDWPFLLFNYMREAGLKPWTRVINVWPTSIFNAPQVIMAKEEKRMLNIVGDLIIMRKPL